MESNDHLPNIISGNPPAEISSSSFSLKGIPITPEKIGPPEISNLAPKSIADKKEEKEKIQL